MRPLPRILCCLLAAVMLPGCSTPAPSVQATADDIPSARTAADVWALPETITIPLVADDGYVFAPVSIDGRNAGLFMIDTGATLTVIDPGTANRLDLPTVGRGTSLGIGGEQDFQYRGFQTLTVGDAISLGESRAAAISLHQITAGLGVSVRGILGYHSFAPLPFTLDPRNRQLILHRPDAYRPIPGSHRERLMRFRRLPVVQATVGDPALGRRVWLIVDTGAHNALTLPAELLQRWPEIIAVPQHGHGRSIGVGGAVPGRQTWVSSLHLMGVTLRDVPTSFEPAQPAMRRAPIPVGRIGTDLLRHFRLSFDPHHDTLDSLYVPITSE